MSWRAAAALGAALLLVATGRTGAQVVPQPEATEPEAPAAPYATALEAWLVRPNRVVVERRHALPAIALGGGAAVVLEAVVAFEPVREQDRALGLRVELRGTERVGRAALAYLDPFEIDELARTLAGLPLHEQLERESRASSEIRYLGRDGFGVVARLAPGAPAPVRALRFGGDPPLDIPASDVALAELGRQLDAARRYLFDAPAR